MPLFLRLLHTQHICYQVVFTMKLNNAIKTIIFDEEENVGLEVAARFRLPDAADAEIPAAEEPDDSEEEENAPSASNRCLTKKRLFGLLSVAVAVL